MTLDEHLGALYRHSVVVPSPDRRQAAVDAFRLALDVDELRPQAAARLAALEGIDEQRCFISKMHRQFLTAALGGL